MDIAKKIGKLKSLRSRPALYFVLLFAVWFSAFAFIGSIAPGAVKSIYKGIGKPVLNSMVNKNPEFKRKAELIDDPQTSTSVRVNIQFLDKITPENIIPIKYINIDVIREGYVPFAFVMALILSTPIAWRRRLRALLWGFLTVQAYVLVKFFVLSFDNFRNPDFVMRPLPGLIDFFVFASNQFLAATGFSSSLIIPIIIWVGVTFRTEEFNALKGQLALGATLVNPGEKK